MTANETKARIREFIELEARLIDDQDFDAWLALYVPECLYWAPVSREQISPLDGVAHIRDDFQLMQARAHRLQNPRRFAAEPPAVTEHIISGVCLEGTVDAQGTLAVSSSQMVLEYRDRDRFEQDQRVFGGRVLHHLITTDDGFKIRLKRIDLINAAGSFNALSVPF